MQSKLGIGSITEVFESSTEAYAFFSEVKNSGYYNYIALINSLHPYSKGYWVETFESNLSEYDFILEIYDIRAKLRAEKINIILNG